MTKIIKNDISLYLVLLIINFALFIMHFIIGVPVIYLTLIAMLSCAMLQLRIKYFIEYHNKTVLTMKVKYLKSLEAIVDKLTIFLDYEIKKDKKNKNDKISQKI